VGGSRRDIFSDTVSLPRARAGQGRPQSLVPEDAQEGIGHGVRASAQSQERLILISSVLPTAAILRSGPSIGTLASAVAKPQGELVNPEKSLVVTTRGGGPRG